MAQPDDAALLKIIKAWARSEARVVLLRDWVETCGSRGADDDGAEDSLPT